MPALPEPQINIPVQQTNTYSQILSSTIFPSELQYKMEIKAVSDKLYIRFCTSNQHSNIISYYHLYTTTAQHLKPTTATTYHIK